MCEKPTLHGVYNCPTSFNSDDAYCPHKISPKIQGNSGIDIIEKPANLLLSCLMK